MKEFVKNNPLYITWLITLFGSALSIYYGEILWIEPCRWCWYQRIALFPLALILGIASYHKDNSAIRYAWPLAIFGCLAALYQAIAVHFPLAGLCSDECVKPIFFLFGWITFPDLSFFGFILINIFLYYSKKHLDH